MKPVWKIILVVWIMISAMFMIVQAGAWVDQGLIDQSAAADLQYLLSLIVWVVIAVAGGDYIESLDGADLRLQTVAAGALIAGVCGAILTEAMTAPNAGFARFGVVSALACALLIGLPVIQRTSHWDRFVGKIERGLST